jgi:hypothetical protein
MATRMMPRRRVLPMVKNLIGCWLEDCETYWRLRVSTRRIQFCFYNTVRDSGCKTAILIVKKSSFAFAFATRLGMA